MQSKHSVVRLDACAEGGGGQQGALTHLSGHYARENAWADARSAMRGILSGWRWLRKSQASAMQIRARDVAVSVHDCSQEAQLRAFSRQVTGTRASLVLGLLARTPIHGQRPQETAHSG